MNIEQNVAGKLNAATMKTKPTKTHFESIALNGEEKRNMLLLVRPCARRTHSTPKNFQNIEIITQSTNFRDSNSTCIWCVCVLEICSGALDSGRHFQSVPRGMSTFDDKTFPPCDGHLPQIISANSVPAIYWQWSSADQNNNNLIRKVVLNFALVPTFGCNRRGQNGLAFVLVINSLSLSHWHSFNVPFLWNSSFGEAIFR